MLSAALPPAIALLLEATAAAATPVLVGLLGVAFLMNEVRNWPDASFGPQPSSLCFLSFFRLLLLELLGFSFETFGFLCFETFGFGRIFLVLLLLLFW